jgi:CubicO group peptidase (beta-lactamase class C family)
MKKTTGLVMGVFLMVAFGLPPLAAGSGEKTDMDVDKVRARLDELLPRCREVFEVPGMVVGLLKDGKVIYSKALGVRRLGSDRQMTTRSLFHMASVSKPFVATAVMQLVEKGKIKPGGKLVEYLPYFRLEDERYKDITIGQMLNHTSGLPDVRDYEWDKPQYDDGAAERYIRSLVKEKMIAAPAERFRYSNMAFDILADVIARASGMTFEQYMKENIFKPLAMKDSTFLKKEVPDELANNAHVLTDRIAFKIGVSEVYPYNRAHAPSSTLHSNVEDMMRWGMANLNHGELAGKRILKPQTHARLWQPTVPAFGDTFVGISWFLGNYKGEKVVAHGGGDVGFRTYFLMVPERKLAVVTMGNSDSYDSQAVVNVVLDVVLGHEPEMPKKPAVVPMGRMLVKEGIKAALQLYRRLKKEQPQRYTFSEAALNRYGYGLLRAKRHEEAIEIFSLNAAEYPESWNVYDSLAEAYLEKGDKDNALKYYQQAYDKNPQKRDFEVRAGQNQKKIIDELSQK